VEEIVHMYPKLHHITTLPVKKAYPLCPVRLPNSDKYSRTLELSSVVGMEAERFVLRQSPCFKYEIARDSEGWTGEEKETQRN